MKYITIFILALLFLTSCGPTPEQVQIAISQTQTAAPTATYTFIPSSTVTPTPTSTYTPTIIPTNTPTLTPTPDIRIVTDDPQKFLLKAKEMPENGKYYIPGPEWMSVNTNEEVISQRGVEEGRNYVISTGRLNGWWVEFLSDTRATQNPKDVFVGVYQFQTAQGAQLALRKFNEVETNEKYQWKYVNSNKGLGDDYIVIKYEETTSGGDKQVSYVFEFTYRNYMVQIGLFDLEKYITHDFALVVGKKVLNKLQAAPLELPPTATPTP